MSGNRREDFLTNTVRQERSTQGVKSAKVC